MSEDILSDIADAVVARIDGATLNQALTVSRKWIPSTELENLIGDCVVPVIGSGDEEVITTRKQAEVTFTIEIGIMKKVSATSGAPVDVMRDLAQEIKALFRFYKLMTGITLKKISNLPVFDPNYLEKRIYVSVISLTYIGFVS